MFSPNPASHCKVMSSVVVVDKEVTFDQSGPSSMDLEQLTNATRG